MNRSAVSSLINEWSKPVPVFVYGTLREGGRLRGFYLDDANVDGKVMRGRVYGYELIDPAWGFPLLSPSPAADGEVTGDLQWVVPDMRLRAMIDMEIGAGYDLALIDVHTDSLAVPVRALAFTWQRDLPTGSQVVESGDWIGYEMERVSKRRSMV